MEDMLGAGYRVMDQITGLVRALPLSLRLTLR